MIPGHQDTVVDVRGLASRQIADLQKRKDKSC